MHEVAYGPHNERATLTDFNLFQVSPILVLALFIVCVDVFAV